MLNALLQAELSVNIWQILKVVEIEKTDDVRRPYIKQLLVKGLKFPLPHRINKKAGKKIFASKRPSTFY
jgi:large subunit ribosomal protein L18Ae|tara:strand:- start:2046 stop:2252 length:207 start_codon:yes stop_codon:yes gene_type:complete